jgi:YD repeat-containing protein
LGEALQPRFTGNGAGLTGGVNPAVFVGATDTGRPQKVTDPRGLTSKADYDLLGRTTQTVENVTDGVVHTAENRTTQYSFDGDDHVTLLTAVQPGGGVQQTQFNYGYSNPIINSNDLLASVYYPYKDGASAGLPNPKDKESFAYNALDQARSGDRNGTGHSYSFDVLGRLTSDQVQNLGSGVDGAVRRLDTAYDTGGRPYLFTSYSDLAGTATVNQVQRWFNGLGQLIKEYQAHTGAVNTGSTLNVQYAYSPVSSTANYSRPTSMPGKPGEEDQPGNGRPRASELNP